MLHSVATVHANVTNALAHNTPFFHNPLIILDPVGNVRGRNPSFFILIFPLPQVNGSELAIISLIASENAFRYLAFLACLLCSFFFPVSVRSAIQVKKHSPDI